MLFILICREKIVSKLTDLSLGWADILSGALLFEWMEITISFEEDLQKKKISNT